MGKVSNLETDWELLFYRRVWLPVRLSNLNDCQIWSPLGTEDVREQNFGFCVDANDKHDDFIAFEIHRAFGVATILLFVADIRHVVLVVQRKSDAKHVHHGYDSHACVLFTVGDDGVDRVDGRRPCAGFSRRALRARVLLFLRVVSSPKRRALSQDAAVGRSSGGKCFWEPSHSRGE